MLTNERCLELDMYVSQLLYSDKKDVNENLKPLNQEEQEYFERILQWEKEKLQENEAYQRKKEKAYEEAENLVRKYLPKEFWSDGFFNSEEYLNIVEETEDEVEQEIDKILSNENPITKLLTHAGRLSSSRLEVFFRLKVEDSISKKLKKEKNIDLKSLKKYITNEYLSDLQKIQDMYIVDLDDYRF